MKPIGQKTASPSFRFSKKTGPFVSVGKPGERLATFGAARLYVKDDYWQTVVRSLVSRAAAVVLQPGATPGTNWEINLVLSSFDLKRVLLLVPNPASQPLAYETTRNLMNTILPVPLPNNPGACSAFVFDDACVPQAMSFSNDRLMAESFIEKIVAMDAG